MILSSISNPSCLNSCASPFPTTRHRDHLWMLGGEIIRRRHEDADLATQPLKGLLFNLIEEEGGPLIWPRITETSQKSFDTTCRKLYRFLQQAENSS
jgi:hypothetical protein